jgi:hypothetical protein
LKLCQKPSDVFVGQVRGEAFETRRRVDRPEVGLRTRLRKSCARLALQGAVRRPLAAHPSLQNGVPGGVMVVGHHRPWMPFATEPLPTRTGRSVDELRHRQAGEGSLVGRTVV